MHNSKKSRKRKILLEITGLTPSPCLSVNTKKITNNSLFDSYEPLKKDRFIVHLENDSEEKPKLINPSRIKSFKFYVSATGEKNIVIESIVATTEWIEEFLSVNICRLYLLDPVGEVVSSFDYDIKNAGYEYELNYSNNNFLSPKFFYRIF